FKGYHAWIIGYRKEYFDMIHLSASTKLPILNGALECELREYEIFEGDYKSFRQAGGKIHHGESQPKGRDRGDRGDRKPGPRKFRDDRRRAANADGDEARYSSPRNKLEERYASRGGGFNRRDRYGRDKSDRYERDNDRRDNDRRDRFSRDDRGFDRRGRDSFGKRRFDDDRREAPAESENPLAVRRNEAALRSITGRQPSLAKPGVKMRPRNNGNNK
ncbi:MAG: hypothetical protein K2G06_07065, partial [Muribaculaceae bacterium]|nr:hypothetical protein [Muribaculaceae bacterium]